MVDSDGTEGRGKGFLQASDACGANHASMGCPMEADPDFHFLMGPWNKAVHSDEDVF